jgi:2-polyprenyl-3-methyl-5-hydroxy-6-metoxy-1,4-benzoquinol methylase
MVRELSHALPRSRVIGIDYSERAIALAKALNPRLEFFQKDIIKETMVTFDAITLVEVFEHIPLADAPRFVKALHDMLTQGGQLHITVPHSNVPVSRKHFQHFTGSSLVACFEADFVVQEICFLDRRSPWVTLLRRTLENEYFILQHWGARNRLYGIYKRHFLLTDEASCGRIYLRVSAR